MQKEKQLLMENVDVQEQFEKVKTILKEIKIQIAGAV